MKRETGPNQVLKLIVTGCACVMVHLGLAVDSTPLVSIPDANLEAAIREHLDKPSGPLTLYEIASIEHFRAIAWGIKNLTGLQYATNLVELDLGSNQIEDLQPLAGLDELRYLYLGNNRIKDLSPLEGLTNIFELDLDGNQIEDIGCLCRFGRITMLSLRDNRIKDVHALQELTSLKRLNLANNFISNPSPLAGLHNLSSTHLLPGMDPDTYRPALDLRGNYLDMNRTSRARQVIRDLEASCEGGILCFDQNTYDRWAGYPVRPDATIDTWDWMGEMDVALAPWVWCPVLGDYLYVREECAANCRGWIFTPDINGMGLYFVDGTDWAWSFCLGKWLFVPDATASAGLGWFYMQQT